MSTHKFWSPKKRAVAVTLRKEGYTFREIAEKVGGGASASGVLRICKKFAESGSVVDKPRAGRPRVSTERDDRELVRLSLENRRKSLQLLRHEWSAPASKATVRRRLISAGLRARAPRRKPLLNVDQRRRRLQWAMDHKEWTLEQWNKVLWSDETKINLFRSDGLQYVWRRKGEACAPQCMIPTVKHAQSVMIWGCMAGKGVGRIAVIQGTVTARKYIDDILGPKMIPSARDLFIQGNPPVAAKPDFIFQQDNAPCHTAHICTAWFRRNGVKVLDWPGNSPDLNPIENLWSRLKTLVAMRRPSNKQQLIESILASWNHVITADNLRTLVESMPRRCDAVIRSRGYPTRY